MFFAAVLSIRTLCRKDRYYRFDQLRQNARAYIVQIFCRTSFCQKSRWFLKHRLRHQLGQEKGRPDDWRQEFPRRRVNVLTEGCVLYDRIGRSSPRSLMLHASHGQQSLTTVLGLTRPHFSDADTSRSAPHTKKPGRTQVHVSIPFLMHQAPISDWDKIIINQHGSS
jgi:hypothetical protein